MLLKVTLFVALATLVTGLQENSAQYVYNYDVQDPYTGDNKNQYEERNGETLRGQYSLDDPDGTRRIVDYTNDPVNGLKITVNKVPNGQLPVPPNPYSAYYQGRYAPPPYSARGVPGALGYYPPQPAAPASYPSAPASSSSAPGGSAASSSQVSSSAAPPASSSSSPAPISSSALPLPPPPPVPVPPQVPSPYYYSPYHRSAYSFAYNPYNPHFLPPYHPEYYRYW